MIRLPCGSLLSAKTGVFSCSPPRCTAVTESRVLAANTTHCTGLTRLLLRAGAASGSLLSLSPSPLPTPSQQASDSHYPLTELSQLSRFPPPPPRPPSYREGSGAEARTREECAWRLPSPSLPPERLTAGISPPSPAPTPFTFQGSSCPRQLAGAGLPPGLPLRLFSRGPPAPSSPSLLPAYKA